MSIFTQLWATLFPPAVPVPNLRTVIPGGVWRGGQPTQDGWDTLKKLGVKRVVKLNMASEGSDAYAISIGLQVYPHPIDTIQQVIEVSKPLFVAALADCLQPGLYIHCEHGQDRTGVMCYLLRRHMGWSKADAVNEMLSLGFHKTLHALWEIVEDDPE